MEEEFEEKDNKEDRENEDVYSEDDEEKIKQRLKSLGYI